MGAPGFAAPAAGRRFPSSSGEIGDGPADSHSSRPGCMKLPGPSRREISVMAESEKKEVAAIAALAYEYVTSDVSVLDNDGIVALVVNDSMFSGFARVV